MSDREEARPPGAVTVNDKGALWVGEGRSHCGAVGTALTAFLGMAQDMPTFSRFGIFSGPDGKTLPSCNPPGSGFKV